MKADTCRHATAAQRRRGRYCPSVEYVQCAHPWMVRRGLEWRPAQACERCRLHEAAEDVRHVKVPDGEE